jgi:hypothetical protein
MRNLAVAVALLAVCVAAAHATPSTLIWIPSTDIQADKTWHLGIDNYFAPGDGSAPTDYGLTYGFLNNKAEAGVDYFGGAEHAWTFNVKYLITPEKGETPAVAVGYYNAGTKKDVTDANMVYAVGSKTFDNVRLTLGACHGKKATLGQGETMLLAGLDGYMDKKKKWWWGADFQSGNSVFGALNFGVAYSFADNVSVILGYDIYNNRDLNPHNTITTQLDINF